MTSPTFARMGTIAKIVPCLPKLEECHGIHAKHCGNCPSRNGSSDPECDDILLMPLAERAKTVFPCGWNRRALCRGYVQLMGLTDEQAIEGYKSGPR